MQTPEQQSSLAQIDAYQARTGMSDRRLSLALGKDHKLIKRIREGRSTIRTIKRVLEHIGASGAN